MRAALRGEEGHYIMIHKSVLQEDKTTPLVHIPGNRMAKQVRQQPTELWGEADKSPVAVGASSSLSRNRETRQAGDQWRQLAWASPSTHLIKLTSIRQSIRKQCNYTSFLRGRGTFSEKDHILGHKTRLHKWKIIEIARSRLSDHSGIKTEIKTRN